jgi:putative sigma-54 modulation protein
MRVHLSGHHVEVTPALRGYVEKKLSRVMRRFDRMIDVHCILTVEKLRHKAESTVFVRGTTLYADAVDGDMYAAIDALADKLDRRVRKHKERVRDHHAFEAQKSRLAPAQ